MNEIPPPPRWTVFARGEREDDRIARCPGGHIHLDYGNLTVRYQRDEFLAFTRMVAEAAARQQGVSPNVADHWIMFRASNPFSLN